MDTPKIEGFEIRELKTPDEINRCIELQGEIWGLDELGRMSPVTLDAMVSEKPKMGIVLGGFLHDEMIAIQIAMPTLEPHTVYLHMLGILKKYRSLHIGYYMQEHLFQILRGLQIKRALWTYEPLEGKNANNYLIKSGARVIKYFADHYKVKNKMSGGMPIDRFLAEVNLDDEFHTGVTHERIPVLSFGEALQKFPVAKPDYMPETDKVLVEIPDDLQKLKADNMQEAKKFRVDTRKIFTEYINNRGFFSEYFYTSVIDGKRKNYYLLQKTNKEEA
jgi:predicted GNAT superfamily acetyltransferase